MADSSPTLISHEAALCAMHGKCGAPTHFAFVHANGAILRRYVLGGSLDRSMSASRQTFWHHH
jgi:hypothetical protein